MGSAIDFKDGKVLVSVDYADPAYGKASLVLELELILLLEMAASKTDNTIDDKMVGMIKAALGK